MPNIEFISLEGRIFFSKEKVKHRGRLAVCLVCVRKHLLYHPGEKAVETFF